MLFRREPLRQEVRLVSHPFVACGVAHGGPSTSTGGGSSHQRQLVLAGRRARAAETANAFQIVGKGECRIALRDCRLPEKWRLFLGVRRAESRIPARREVCNPTSMLCIL